MSDNQLGTRPRGWNTELDEVEDIDALLVELAPLHDVRVDSGAWTLGGPGMDGILEWFSPEGTSRPELLRAMATACRVATALAKRVQQLEDREPECPRCGMSSFSCCRW